MESLIALGPHEGDEWTRIVEASWRHDFYHLPAYHMLAQERGEGEARLFVYREAPFTISVPLLIRPVGGETAFQDAEPALMDATSVYGYPGPIQSHEAVPPEVISGFVLALTEALRELRVVTVFSRLNPLLPQTHLLAGMGDCPVIGETVSLDLTRSSDELWGGYRDNHRRHINKNRRIGLVCIHDREFSHLDDFIDLYHETMRRVEAGTEYFFDQAYFKYLCTRMRSNVHLFVAKVHGEVVSGGLFTACRGVVQYHLGGTRAEWLRTSPLKSVLDATRIWGAQDGMRVLHLGGGAGAQDDALLTFKAGFSDDRNLFRIWKWVVLPDAYARLTSGISALGRTGDSADRSGFFPAYRAQAS